jgi:hypothetical protein
MTLSINFSGSLSNTILFIGLILPPQTLWFNFLFQILLISPSLFKYRRGEFTGTLSANSPKLTQTVSMLKPIITTANTNEDSRGKWINPHVDE